MKKNGKTEAKNGVRASFWTRLFDLMSPRLCVACGSRLAESEQHVCSNCVLTLPRTDHSNDPYDSILAKEFWGRLPVERVAAWLSYQPDTPVSRLIHEMKYHDNPAIGRYLGEMMALEFQESGFFRDIDVLLPVPLAPQREQQRGYNQSREIARGISTMTGIPVVDNAMRRIRFEQSQTHMHIEERQANVEGAFELTDATQLTGRHVLVVDDVITTGATMKACCKELLQAGDVRISIIALGFTRG